MSRDRSSLLHQVRYALRTRDHVGYYRAVMRSDAARSPEAAVGSRSHDRWSTWPPSTA